MTQIITTEFLKSKNVCQEGIDWVRKYENKEAISVLEKLIEDKKLDWANWLIVRVMASYDEKKK